MESGGDLAKAGMKTCARSQICEPWVPIHYALKVAMDALALARQRRDVVQTLMKKKQQGGQPQESMSTPAPVRKRIRAKVTPMADLQRTPSTKTPDAKNPKTEEQVRRELFRSLSNIPRTSPKPSLGILTITKVLRPHLQ